MSPPSLGETDLSPAEEEIPPDLKSDHRSEDECDDPPSVWSQRDVYGLKPEEHTDSLEQVDSSGDSLTSDQSQLHLSQQL